MKTSSSTGWRSGILKLACAALVMMTIAGAGCPLFGPPATAVLAGDWQTVDEDGNNAFVRFDANGNLIGILTRNAEGTLVLIQVNNATSAVDGSAVTVTIPTPLVTAVYTGTLSEDQNTITGMLNNVVEIGDDLTVILPQGEVILTRVTLDDCDFITCDPGEECVDGECVVVDPCEGVTCDPGEECVDGECVVVDPCEGVTCDPGEECVDGECVVVDPCEGVTCDPGEECVDGECVPVVDPCEGVTCDPGEECVDGECVPVVDPCEGVTCDPGEECVDGECVPTADPCEGVTCEIDEECVDGVCEPLTGDPVAGQAFYDANGCMNCHGPNGNDGFAPSLIGVTAAQFWGVISGENASHPGSGTVEGATNQDAVNLEAAFAP